MLGILDPPTLLDLPEQESSGYPVPAASNPLRKLCVRQLALDPGPSIGLAAMFGLRDDVHRVVVTDAECYRGAKRMLVTTRLACQLMRRPHAFQDHTSRSGRPPDRLGSEVPTAYLLGVSNEARGRTRPGLGAAHRPSLGDLTIIVGSRYRWSSLVSPLLWSLFVP